MKTDRRRIRTKKNIKNALLKLIQVKPLNKITITELANEADIDRKTFYLHYQSISAILVEIGNEIEKDLSNSLKNNQPNFSVKDLILQLNAIMMEDYDFYKLITKEDAYSVLKNQFKDILKSSIKTAFFNPRKQSETHFLFHAEYISSGVIGIYSNWLDSNTEMTIEELTDIIEDAITNSWENIIKFNK